MLEAWRKPYDIAGTDLLDGPTLALDPAEAGRDNQGLAERMCMPCGTGPRLEGNAGPSHPRGVRRGEKRVDAHRAGEVLGRAFAGGLRTSSLDFHVSNSFLEANSRHPRGRAA